MNAGLEKAMLPSAEKLEERLRRLLGE